MKGWVLDCQEDFPSPLIGPKSSHRHFPIEKSPLISDRTASELSENVREAVGNRLVSGPVLEHSVILQATVTHGHLGERAVAEEIRRLYSRSDTPVRSESFPGLRMSASEFDGTFAKPQK